MSIVYLQETTDNWKAEYRVPCHTYLIQGEKMVGYVKEGTTKIKMFTKPLRFEKSRRKFKTLSETAFNKLGYA